MAGRAVCLVAFAACLVAALAAPAAVPRAGAAIFNTNFLVPNITTDCPVRNVKYEKSEFDAEELPSLLDVLQRGNVSQPCQEGAMDLMGCYSDGSLAVKTGCCSKDCAQSIDKSITSGCFTEYAKAVCNDPDAKKKFLGGLTNAGARCANFQGTCEDIMAGKPLQRVNATAVANATRAANATGAAADTPASPAPRRSSALQAAASAVLPLAAAAAAAVFAL